MVFITSGGRTGTQFMGDRLHLVIKDCYSVHEPDILYIGSGFTFERIRQFGIWHMVTGRILGLTGIRVIGQKVASRRGDRDKLLQKVHRQRQRYFNGIPSPLLVESNCQWWLLADELLELWPTAKLISIIRDPRDWIRSWRNKGIRYTRSDPVHYFWPGRLSPSKLGQSKWAEEWKSFGPFEKLAWEWNTIYSRLDESAVRHRNSRIFRFEDLFAETGDTMHELVSFAATHGEARYEVANLSDFGRTIKNASEKRTPDWRDWSPREAQFVNEMCGRLMTKYGYGVEPEWQAKLGY